MFYPTPAIAEPEKLVVELECSGFFLANNPSDGEICRGVVGTPELKIELTDSPYIIAQREAEKRQAEQRAVAAKKKALQPSLTVKPSDNVVLGQRLAAEAGWTGEQWTCLYNLWQKESSWRENATNGRTWGIPQSLPGNKMASAGADWKTNPETQVRWGIGYIKSSYGSACKAWQHSQARNWY